MYPGRPITMIVPFTAGGPTDTQIRALSHAAARVLGQPIVVENRPGVSGTLGPSTMARTAARDGYTLAMITPALFRLPHLQPVSYDAMNDFTYIVGLTSYVQGVSVAADSPWKTMAHLIDYARANPGKVSVASVGTGSLGQITVARLSRAAGIKLNFVPFKGGSEANNDDSSRPVGRIAHHHRRARARRRRAMPRACARPSSAVHRTVRSGPARPRTLPRLARSGATRSR